jgi:uncharacterized protein with von Willebrand factor type A (vWA) domain
LKETELALIQSMILKLAQTLGRRLSRRYASSSRKGAIDLRATLRRSLGMGGEMLEIRHRRHRIKRARLHLLLDISGSMDMYGRFFLVFMYGMQRRLFKAESYVFSTRLTRVSEPLKNLPFRQALTRIQAMDINWSGGTDIGGSLMDFLSENPGPGGGDRDVVILVSDGWDRGNPKNLAKAIKMLRRYCRILIWLNPLMASESYRPINRGARIMLPFVDYLLPFYNFASLAELDRVIRATPPISNRFSARSL